MSISIVVFVLLLLLLALRQLELPASEIRGMKSSKMEVKAASYRHIDMSDSSRS